MWIEVLDETGRFRRRERLREVVARVARAVGCPAGGSLTIVLADDATIAERNARDRGVAGPTDVLAYPTAEPDDVGVPRVPHLGDVWISLDTAARQARGQRPTWHEVSVLAAHALLHLRGFDHGDAAAWAPFEAVQDLAETEAKAVDQGRSLRALLAARSTA